MKITRVEAFQVSWAPDDKPQQRSAFVRVHGDDGLSGIGESGLTGRELYAVEGVDNAEAHEVTVRADDKSFTARVRLDTPREREYLRHGGILRYVLRRLAA